MPRRTSSTIDRPTFIDLFSGCGGLSLGLSQAGWQGIFAIERATDAFATFQCNFLAEESRYRFLWPSWLEAKAHSIDDVLENHYASLEGLKGGIDLIAGGPPCQGFSFAGRRNESDPRNRMFERYVHLVKLLQPRALVLENVPGMGVAHAASKKAGKRTPYTEKLQGALEHAGYVADWRVLDASNFGVPQRRPRLVVVGLRSDIASFFDGGASDIFNWIEKTRLQHLLDHELELPITAEQAISDLALEGGRPTIEYDGQVSRRGFQMPRYTGPLTPYQELMHDNIGAERMDSLRLANHTKEVRRRFVKILRCRKGVNLSFADREKLGMLKHRTVPMAPAQSAPTITTLPDDILHYSDPRILSVRECARLQSFPDWFGFRGKYTTGGERRRVECPRYTQVGNAVPPMLARVIGSGIREALAFAKEQREPARKSKVRLIEERTAG